MNDLILDIQDLRYLKWTKTRNSSGTAGSFLKSYDNAGDLKQYYKLSDYNIQDGVIGHECINEIIAQRLLRHLGIDHLDYTLIHALISLDGQDIETYLCRSNDYKKLGESKLPLEDFYVMEREEKEMPMDFCIRMGWAEYIYDMLISDFLIINRDRHGANIEVLIDRKNKTRHLAPLFDQGVSFICRCYTSNEVRTFDAMQDTRVQSFIGGASLFDNLSIVPKDYVRKLPRITDTDISTFLSDLENVIDSEHLEKIKEIIIKRRAYLDSI